uniref:MSP domain-containing protein n=1 Tax=Setaria digitata TaxID=48799 RepID=A0A915Q0Y9_9BILA
MRLNKGPVKHLAGENEKLNEATIVDHLPPRLSTIVEESNIGEGNDIATRKDPYTDSVFGGGLKGEISTGNVNIMETSSLFGDVRDTDMLQRDQESFFKKKLMAQDDFRFSKPYLEKENSWEPSIHCSPPPTPKIRVEELAAFNMTDSHLIPATSPTATTRNEANPDIENTPPSSSHVHCFKRRNKPEHNFGGPKMSTPKCSIFHYCGDLRITTETSLRSLSINCISSIYPETASPKSTYGINTRFNGVFTMARGMSKVEEEPSLSSSAIDRVLEGENFDNDDALVEALLQAKTRPRLKLKFPEITTDHYETDHTKRWLTEAKKPDGALGSVSEDSNAAEYNPMQKGITNKTKGSKTVRELDLPLEGSNTAGNLPSDLKTESKNENSRTDSACSLQRVDAENQGKFLSCDQSFLYFGFVDIKCRVNRTLRLRNFSSKSLNLKLQLHSMSRGFELLEEGIVVLKSQETHFVHIIFQPPFGALFQNCLSIRVLNSEHICYYIPLLGSGGVAALRVLTQSGLTMLRDGSFVLTAQGITNISFDVENKGLRDAFVRVVVMDKETKKSFDRCTIAPSDCVSILHRTKQRFTIEVPSLSNEENNGSSNRSYPLSSFSTQSIAGNTQYYVQLLWGEEAQRRRLKRYEKEKCADFTFNGHTFTKCKFKNERKCKSTASEDACYGPYDRDAFELGLRVTLISVVDNRLSLISRNSCLSQQQILTESIILEPNVTLAAEACNRSIVEDVSTVFTASRLL